MRAASRDNQHLDSAVGNKGGGKKHSSTNQSAGSHGQFCQHCPAWLGCLGLEPTPALFVQHCVELFREVRRVLRDDGCLWLNLGDSYNAGTSAKRKSPKTGVDVGGWNDAEIDGGARINAAGLKPKDLIGIPWLVAMALRDDGWYLRSAMPWVKRSAMPDSAQDRPGSALEYVFLLSKSPRYFWDHDAVRRAPSGISGGACFGGLDKAKANEKVGSALRTQGREATQEDRDRYAQTGRQIRNADLWFQSIDEPHGMVFCDDEIVGLDVNPAGFKGAHFATWPPKLVKPLLLSTTSERGCCEECGKPWKRLVDKTGGSTGRDWNRRRDGDKDDLMNGAGTRNETADGTYAVTTTGWEPSCCCASDTVPAVVLDPFSGAGTTVMVARQLGLRGIGFELNPEYAEMGRKRIVADAPLMNL